MTRIAGLLFLLTAVSAALFLFHIKQQVREMEQELDLAQRAILDHQEEIRVLETEWSYLNRPARIARLARQYLDLAPFEAAQFMHIADLPPRAPVSARDRPGGPQTDDLPLLTRAGAMR